MGKGKGGASGSDAPQAPLVGGENDPDFNLAVLNVEHDGLLTELKRFRADKTLSPEERERWKRDLADRFSKNARAIRQIVADKQAADDVPPPEPLDDLFDSPSDPPPKYDITKDLSPPSHPKPRPPRSSKKTTKAPRPKRTAPAPRPKLPDPGAGETVPVDGQKMTPPPPARPMPPLPAKPVLNPTSATNVEQVSETTSRPSPYESVDGQTLTPATWRERQQYEEDAERWELRQFVEQEADKSLKELMSEPDPSPDDGNHIDTGHYDDGHSLPWKQPAAGVSGGRRTWLTAIVATVLVALVATVAFALGAPGRHTGASPVGAPQPVPSESAPAVGPATLTVQRVPEDGKFPSLDYGTCVGTFTASWIIQGPPGLLDGQTALAKGSGPGLDGTYKAAVANGQVTFVVAVPGSAWGAHAPPDCLPETAVSFSMDLVSIGSYQAVPPDQLVRR